MKPKTVAVLDVGKTNKKIRLYDRGYNVLAEERCEVPPVDFNGVEVEDTERLLGWLREALKKLSATYHIASITITTHGATAALLDADGKLSHPVISYTAEAGQEVQEEFYSVFGDRDTLHKETFTPDIGFANLGKSFYYVKTRLPEVWAKTKHALYYTTYLSYELCGKMGVEPTYAGNHTYMWNAAKNDYSSVGKALGADKLFPAQMQAPWETLGVVKKELVDECGLPADCRVTLGLHDSNANFLPYLAKGYKNFLLNSTGTWCVLMKQSDTTSLTDEERAAKVFFNLDVHGKPVRTCVFPAGMEYGVFRAFTSCKDTSDEATVRDVVNARELFVIPGVLPDASAFPGAAPGVMNKGVFTPLSALQAAADQPMTALGLPYFGALNTTLALATVKNLHCCGISKGTTVFIEGGFTNNMPYCELLATLLPEQNFVFTSVKEGTSFGAALAGWMAAEGLTLDQVGAEFSIETTPIAKQDFGDLAAYEKAFLQLTKA